VATVGEHLGDGSLGTVEVGPGEAIQIRSLNAISGDVAFLGIPNENGIRMAVEDYGQIGGHDVDLGAGMDDLCSADGGQAAAQTIVADQDVIGVIGTSCSGAATAASPLISEAGMVMISGSNTSPALTSDLAGTAGKNYHAGYYRTAHNDLYQGAAAANFALDVLGVTTAAAIHDGDPYTEGLATAFADAFASGGGTVTGFTAVNKGDSDMVPVLTEVAAGSPEMLFFPIFQPEGDFIIQQSSTVAGLEDTIMMAADGLLNSNFLAVAETQGMFFSGPDVRYGSNYNQSTGESAADVLADYKAEFGEAPAAPFWAHSYDAAALLMDAIAAASYDDGGTLVVDRAGVREHLNGVTGYSGLIGTMACDAYGDCSSSKITVIQNIDIADYEASTANVVYEYAPLAATQVGDIVAGAEKPTYGGSVTIGVEAEATGLRPWEDACSSPCYNMMIVVFDKLFEQNEVGSYVPNLATGISVNDDFTVWTMSLQSGVRFHDGSAFNAQSLSDMWAIQQGGAAAAGHIAATGLTTVEVTGDLEVTYTLSKTNSAFPSYLSRAPLGMVFEPGAAAADTDAFSLAPVGTGPFVIESRDIDNETIFTRNPNYWQKDIWGRPLPYLDSFAVRPIPDETTRLASLTSGTVTAMQSLRQATIRDAREAEGITLYEFQGNNAGGGHFNVLLAPYDDVRVRRGLTLANNQEAVIEALGGKGISGPGTQFFSPDSPWWSQAVHDAYPHFDYEAGKALIQEYVDDPERSDGKAVGENIEVTLACPPDPTLIAAMSVLEQLWSGTGMVDVTLVNTDQQTHINVALGLANGFQGEHGAHCWRWGGEDDPSVGLGDAYAPWQMSPLNFSNYSDDEASAALAEAITTDDFARRKELYETVGLVGARDVPMWYSGHTATVIAVADGIVGLDNWITVDGQFGIGHPNAEGRWHQVWWDN
jgi:peptide/nickel transport system substrate-binding protein